MNMEVAKPFFFFFFEREIQFMMFGFNNNSLLSDQNINRLGSD